MCCPWTDTELVVFAVIPAIIVWERRCIKLVVQTGVNNPLYEFDHISGVN